jgi:hypothetical protein
MIPIYHSTLRLNLTQGNALSCSTLIRYWFGLPVLSWHQSLQRLATLKRQGESPVKCDYAKAFEIFLKPLFFHKNRVNGRFVA